MSPAILISLAIFVGLPLLALTSYGLWRHFSSRKAMDEALQESCLLCDSKHVDVRDDVLDYYRCPECGFDSERAQQPDVAGLVDQFRDLGYALEQFQWASEKMRKAQTAATMDAMGGGSQAKYEHMARASEHQSNGLRHLQDLIDEHPHLLEMAVAGDNIDDSDYMWDKLGDGIVSNMNVRGKVKESRQQVEQYTNGVRHLRRQLQQTILQRM